MQLRPARLSDAALLFEWRNDPDTRRASINSEPVKWDGHIMWLIGVFGNPDRALYIAEEGGEPVGTVRMDGDELSWTVAPKSRGRGVGTRMVQAAMDLGPRLATIKRDNISSQRIAEKAGFVLSTDGELQTWIVPGAAEASREAPESFQQQARAALG